MKIENGSIINQYKIISAIGKGGMGEVFLAQDTKLDRKVAIKFLNEEFSRDADKLNRFVQEAKAVSALNHPNILIVHEIGESADSNYIVTEFIEANNLAQSNPENRRPGCRSAFRRAFCGHRSPRHQARKYYDSAGRLCESP
jgi:serine/threonine protein kinase